MIPFIPLINCFWMCIEPFLSQVQTDGKRLLEIWSVMFWSHPILSTKALQISGQAIIMLCVTLDLTTVYVAVIPWNCPWSISDSELIHLPFESLCYSQYIISSRLHDCGSEANPIVCRDEYTTVYWLISSIQQLIPRDTSVLKYEEILASFVGYSSPTGFHITDRDSNHGGFQV